jgi:hypothetical protein
MSRITPSFSRCGFFLIHSIRCEWNNKRNAVSILVYGKTLRTTLGIPSPSGEGLIRARANVPTSLQWFGICWFGIIVDGNEKELEKYVLDMKWVRWCVDPQNS